MWPEFPLLCIHHYNPQTRVDSREGERRVDGEGERRVDEEEERRVEGEGERRGAEEQS